MQHRLGFEKCFARIDLMKLTPHTLFSAIVPAPFGAVGIRISGQLVRELVYLPPGISEKMPDDEVSELAVRELERYFADPDYPFDMRLTEAGTAFQRRVWEVISSIPRGAVLTYGDVARRLGSAPRAVGQACGANPFPLVIPCHRVTSSTGLGGFANSDDPSGFLLGVKRWLLQHEGASFEKQRLL
jgi:methylated-DNA-[protein]-cysteine S-methyltransferase